MSAFLQINGTGITHSHREINNNNNQKLITNKGYKIASQYLRNEVLRIYFLHKPNYNHKLPPLDVIMHKILLNPNLIDSKQTNNNNNNSKNELTSSLDESELIMNRNKYASWNSKKYLNLINTLPSLPQQQQPNFSIKNSFAKSLPKISKHVLEESIPSNTHSAQKLSKLPDIFVPIWPQSLRKQIQIINALRKRQKEEMNNKLNSVQEDKNLKQNESPILAVSNKSETSPNDLINSSNVDKVNTKYETSMDGKQNLKHTTEINGFIKEINNIHIEYKNKEENKHNSIEKSKNESSKTNKEKKIEDPDAILALNEYHMLIRNRRLILIDETEEKYKNTKFKF